MPKRTSATQFSVNWTGTDEESGVRSYDIYVSTNGSQYSLWLDDTRATSATFSGVTGNTYSFYSIASDNVGHSETKSPIAESTTLVVLGSLWRNHVEPLDVNSNSLISPSDALEVINYLNSGLERFLVGTNFVPPPYLDVDGNELVSPSDALLVINYLNQRVPEGESTRQSVFQFSPISSLPFSVLPPNEHHQSKVSSWSLEYTRPNKQIDGVNWRAEAIKDFWALTFEQSLKDESDMNWRFSDPLDSDADQPDNSLLVLDNAMIAVLDELVDAE